MPAEQAHLGKPGASVDARPLEGMRLVVTGGHALLLNALAAYLEHRGADVVGTSQDQRGMERLVLQHQPDACIFQPDLNGQGGTRAAEQVRRQAPEVKLVSLATRSESSAGCTDASVPLGDGLDQLESQLLRLLDRPPNGVAHEPWGRRVAGFPDWREELSGREEEVLRLLGRGASNATIAEELGISVNTVRTHVHNVLQKLGVQQRVQAALAFPVSYEDQASESWP